ncbi:uncharacterized protein LOC125650064 isoform X1 [Ostrea edulis]|uniref:uncharacterized protein LOC125650064 isoform X1 n=1 Tax=Ostrea edulis TaxID=37623 RepID=UPI0024AFAB46|nr:uncharacterized protein LOC125650064 isoform X1 [Ostrea edulis]
MADPRIKQIKIKTGVVKRLTKEKVSYEEEALKTEEKVEKMKSENKDEYEIKKMIEVLQESKMMVPDTLKRLKAGYADLENLLVCMICVTVVYISQHCPYHKHYCNSQCIPLVNFHKKVPHIVTYKIMCNLSLIVPCHNVEGDIEIPVSICLSLPLAFVDETPQKPLDGFCSNFVGLLVTILCSWSYCVVILICKIVQEL